MSNELQVREKVEVENQAEETRDMPAFVPAVDIFETEDAMTVAADMPGATAEGLSIDLKDDVLTIRGRTDVPDKERNVRYREYRSGNYLRRFTVSDVFDRDRIKATLKDGVLTLELPKADKAKPRQIEVKSA